MSLLNAQGRTDEICRRSDVRPARRAEAINIPYLISQKKEADMKVSCRGQPVKPAESNHIKMGLYQEKRQTAESGTAPFFIYETKKKRRRKLKWQQT